MVTVKVIVPLPAAVKVCEPPGLLATVISLERVKVKTYEGEAEVEPADAVSYEKISRTKGSVFLFTMSAVNPVQVKS